MREADGLLDISRCGVKDVGDGLCGSRGQRLKVQLVSPHEAIRVDPSELRCLLRLQHSAEHVILLTISSEEIHVKLPDRATHRLS